MAWRAPVGRRLAAALGLLALGACAATPPPEAPTLPAGCEVTRRAEAPAVSGPAGLTVEARVAGQPTQLLVDTGANNLVLLFGDVARRIGLEVRPGRPTQGVTGRLETSSSPDVALEFGPEWRGRGEVTVVPPPPGPRRIDGLLGTRAFAGLDVDLDSGAGRIRLHEVRGCGPGFVPLGEPHEVLPLLIGPGGLPGIRVQLNGRDAIGLLDTGADRTVLLRPAVAFLDGGTALLSRQAVPFGADVSGRPVPLVPVRVRSFTIGERTLENFTGMLSAAPLDIAHVLIGRDWVAGRRIWISYATGRVFIARERPGGRLAAR